MTQQSDFFSRQQPSETGSEQVIILNEAATNKPKKRVFVYDGQYFEDPGPEYTIEDVLNFLAQTYPELENGAWHSRRMPDDTEEITFVKVTGEKGMDVTARLIAARLTAGTQPTRIQAIELLNQLMAVETDGALTVSYLLEAEPRIEAALHQAEQVAQASQRIVARCIALKPVPLPRVPLGF
jgi:PRTRC genetic system protein C